MPTFDFIGKYTATGGETQITFNPIASSWTDLMILGSSRTGAGSSSEVDVVRITFNNDNTSGNYSNTRFYQVDSTPYSNTSLNNSPGAGLSGGVLVNAAQFSAWHCYIPSYAGTALQKTFLAEGVVPGTYAFSWSSRWNQTNAITRIDLYPEYGGSFVNYSNFYLYGIYNG